MNTEVIEALGLSVAEAFRHPCETRAELSAQLNQRGVFVAFMTNSVQTLMKIEYSLLEYSQEFHLFCSSEINWSDKSSVVVRDLYT